MPRIWIDGANEMHVSLDGLRPIAAFCEADQERAAGVWSDYEGFTQLLDVLDEFGSDDDSVFQSCGCVYRACGECRQETIDRAKLEELFWLLPIG